MVKIRRLIAVLILIVSLGFLLWVYWPRGASIHSLALSLSDLVPKELVASGPPSISGSYLSTGRHLELHWQHVIPRGDPGQVQLFLKIDGQDDSVAFASRSNQKTIGSGAYHVLAEARLEISGMEVAPSDVISQSLIPGEPLAFTWTIHPQVTGVSHGIVWFTLHFLPIGSGQELEKTISAQRFDVQVIDLFGQDGSRVRLMGFIGIAFGLLVGCGDILSQGVRGWIKKKQRGGS